MAQMPANATLNVLIASGQIAPNAVATTTQTVALPTAATYIQLQIDRTTLPAAVGAPIIQCAAEVSYDGGVTWLFLIGFGADGGVSRDQNGVALPASFVLRKVKPEKSGFQRQVRATVKASTLLTTQVTLGYW